MPTHEEMVQRVALFFKDDLLEVFNNPKSPRFRTALIGGYGLKMLLETKYSMMDRVRTYDLDLTVSTLGASLTLEEIHDHWTRKIAAFVEQQKAEDPELVGEGAGLLEVEPMLTFGPRNEPLRGERVYEGHVRYALHRVRFGEHKLMEILISNQRLPNGDYDAMTSKKTGFPIKTESSYLHDMLVLIYKANVRETDFYSYRKRNPIEGAMPDKGEQDIDRASLLCNVAGNSSSMVPFRKYCDFLARITIEKMKLVSKKVREQAFKKLFRGLITEPYSAHSVERTRDRRRSHGRNGKSRNRRVRG